jgi:hypothetical protein
MPSRFAHGSLSGFWLHTCALSGGGDLTAGEVGPGQVNKRGEPLIGLTGVLIGAEWGP